MLTYYETTSEAVSQRLEEEERNRERRFIEQFEHNGLLKQIISMNDRDMDSEDYGETLGPVVVIFLGTSGERSIKVQLVSQKLDALPVQWGAELRGVMPDQSTVTLGHIEFRANPALLHGSQVSAIEEADDLGVVTVDEHGNNLITTRGLQIEQNDEASLLLALIATYFEADPQTHVATLQDA